MSTAEPAPLWISAEDYLRAERAATDTKSEWYRGAVFAMTGSSLSHNRINQNLNRIVSAQLAAGRCEIFSNDLRVKAGGIDPLYAYPDLIVVCSEPEIEDEYKDTLLNPTAVFEILSHSTERFDRGQKAAAYRRIKSLRQYALISQKEAQIELYTRQSAPGNETELDNWLLSEIRGIDSMLILDSVGVQIPLLKLYENVAVAPEPAPPAGE